MIVLRKNPWGLGNQLFRIAAAVSLAMNHGVKWQFPRLPAEHSFRRLTGECDVQANADSVHVEGEFKWSKIRYDGGVLELDGFFQSERYFQDHAKKIRELFALDASPVKVEPGTFSVHVRRGDYFNFPRHHPVSTWRYYDRAMKLALQKGARNFLVFSDDLPWCMETFAGMRTVSIAPEAHPTEHLSMMSACAGHIIANSTFSWWGAWLDPKADSPVIAPREWFGPGYAYHDIRDLLPKDWVRL